jgi:hypothetical protein
MSGYFKMLVFPCTLANDGKGSANVVYIESIGDLTPILPLTAAVEPKSVIQRAQMASSGGLESANDGH